MPDAHFSRWLRRQALRDDDIGRLSRALNGDEVAPAGLRRDVYLAALDQARAEYREETSHPSERFPGWGSSLDPPPAPRRPASE